MSRPVVVSLLVAALILVAGCGGSGSGGAEPTPEAGAADNTGGSGGSGGGDGSTGGNAADIPTITEGYYTTGTTHVEVSGEASQTADVELIGAASGTFPDGTVLQFASGEGEKGVSVVIGIDKESGASIAFTSAAIVAGGGAEQDCSFNLDKNDASGISGSFACSGLAGLVPGGITETTVNLNATFAANR